MSTQAKRLDKVEGSLTPKQAAILWLREARQYPDSTAYSRSLKGQPPAAFPMSVMERQMETSLNAAMKGSPRSDIQRAIWQAQRDCVFLFKVVTTTNLLWYEHERALFIGRVALAAMLRPLLEHQADGFGPKGKRRDDYLLHAQHFVRFMGSFLGEVLVLRQAFAAVGERYFDGEPVLFSGDAADISCTARLGMRLSAVIDASFWEWFAYEWQYGTLFDIVAAVLINVSLTGMLVLTAIAWSED